jgi:hypothetical protein
MKYECGMQASEFDPKPPVPHGASRRKDRKDQEISGRKEGYVFTASHTVTRPLSENTLNAARNSAAKQSRRD